MDTKSKILVGVLLVAILVTIFLTYQRSFVDKNFVITIEEEVVEGETE